MLESAVLAGIVHYAQFQQVDYLLSGRLCGTDGVVPGTNGQQIVKGDVARSNIAAQAAAVYNADVGIGYDAESVGAKVAEVGLQMADSSMFRGLPLNLTAPSPVR